jgi:EmrB/QacA subfamily drug resistance transporter
MTAKRIVPLIVAVALFMENMDSTVIATSLPAIAADIGTDPLALKLAVTSYLLSLAVFIPVSGWTADRFGARTVFRAAIAVFMLGSIGCALSGSLTQLVIARIVEGMGGAMMTPVARLILVRSVDKRELINAMIWVTLPALIGPLLGPPLGGFITTYISWHWIFLINIPIGLAGIVLATLFIEDLRAAAPDPFDGIGALLAGLGIGGLAFGGSVLGLLPAGAVVALIAGGAVATFAYVLHARRTPAPVLDLSLLKIPTLRAAVLGGFVYRCGIGAMPFLLPLLLQLGFDLTAFQSGLITLSNVVGAMGMKTVVPLILRRFGFRRVLVVNALISAALVAACATFQPGVSFAFIVGMLIVGGFFRSLEFTSLNTIAYADIDTGRMSRATSLVAVGQQVSISVGVAIGALAVDLTLWARGHGHSAITAADFQPAFLAIAAIAACASVAFARMPADAGAELARRTPAPAPGPTEAADQKLG